MELSVPVLRRVLRLVLLCLLAAAAWPLQAAALRLPAGGGSIDAWPATRMLVDVSPDADATTVLARLDQFVAPDVPRANLGARREPVWLALTVEVAAGAPRRWVFAAEYASLDSVRLFLVRDGRPSDPIEMGRRVPDGAKPLPSAWPAAIVELEPGARTTLLLRIESRSTLVLPLRLSTIEAHLRREASAQVLQGVLAGATLCLLLYSLGQWIGLRDRMFLAYAMTLGGTGVFFLAYHGLGAQHLWGASAWWTDHMPLLAVLTAIVGGCLFVDLALDVPRFNRWVSRALRLIAGTAAVLALACAFDVAGYRVTQLLASLLGPLPMLIAIPVAWHGARRGDQASTCILIGWGAYGVATVSMALLLRGLAPLNTWTGHSFQIGAAIEMLMWLRVLGLHVQALRTSAQRATVERDALHALAHTDALTGLPNRRGLQGALDRVLDAAVPEKTTAVYLLDLDGFKRVNDELGHEAGDRLLVAVSARLRSLLRSSDVVARLGGDEFVVVAAQLRGDADAQVLGQKMLDGFRLPFEIDGRPCRVGLTAGYALAPADAGDVQTLLRVADAAMFAGKQAGRHCLRRGAAPRPAPGDAPPASTTEVSAPVTA